MIKVAIIGCGQLARMMALRGWSMNIRFSFLAEVGESVRPVEGLGKIVVRDSDDTTASIYERLGRPDVVTVEREQVDVSLLRQLKVLCPVYPDPDIIAASQHRLKEKQALQRMGLPVADFVPVNNRQDLLVAAEQLALPFFVKSCEHGYDGKNQWRIDDSSMIDAVAEKIAGRPAVAEKAIDFITEASVIGVRSVDGEMAVYPLTENRHQQGILLSSIAPAETLSPAIRQLVRHYIYKLMKEWQYVGVLAMELFVTDKGVLVNELAPRVHNSGHWTMNGADTCQFENHLRAISGLAPGATSARGYCGMINLLGKDAPPKDLLNGSSYAHLYNKSLKPGRKMGHINIRSHERDELEQQIGLLLANLYQDNGCQF